VHRPAGARARVSAKAALIADDLVEIDEISVVWDGEEHRVLGEGDKPLERPTRDRPQLEPVADAEPELDDRGTEGHPIPIAMMTPEISALRNGLNETVRAAAGNAEPRADLGDSQAVGLLGK
jgi:hypothetical protein